MLNEDGPKTHIGRSAKKISKLPGLSDFTFARPRKQSKARNNNTADNTNDAEKQQPHDRTQGQAPDDITFSPPRFPDRLSQMRQSLGVPEEEVGFADARIRMTKQYDERCRETR
jgi:hypothetical protein